MFKLTIEGNRARVPAPVPTKIVSLSVRLEGMKKWPVAGGFTFEPTVYNMRLFKEEFPDVEVDDQREEVRLWKTVAPVIQGGRSGSGSGRPTAPVVYQSLTQPYGDFQVECTQKGVKGLLDDGFFLMLMEQGLGKSKCAVDIAGELWCLGRITGVVIVAFNGVHVQWTQEAIPDHLGKMVPRRTYPYKKGKKTPEHLLQTDKLAFFSINFESCFRKDGSEALEQFIAAHKGRVIFIVDEGQRIKNPDAKSTQEIVDLGRYCEFRMDLTGTPMAKDLTDIWSQLKFADPEGRCNLGHKYKGTFRAEYCRMHPKIQGMVVGAKKEAEFYSKIAPHIYRITKSEALPGMPPKVYDKVVFELHPEQRKLYDELRTKFIAKIDSGEVVSVKNALVLVMRLQQITCGYIALDKDDPDEATKFKDLPNPRMDALKHVLRSRIGKHVIWCRFTRDVHNCLREINSAVSYFGGDGRDEKIENKRAFIENPHITDLVSNPAAGGTGVDGLQKVARTAIYYSNSYNVIQRWQSEDRIDRIGMGEGSSWYFDLIARNTVDVGILANHRKKKQLSDLVLDDIRQLLMVEED